MEVVATQFVKKRVITKQSISLNTALSGNLGLERSSSVGTE